MIRTQQRFLLRSFSTSFLPRKQFPSYVKIVEVGPRDGLQNEKVLTVYVCETQAFCRQLEALIHD
jgi:hypothetical protein